MKTRPYAIGELKVSEGVAGECDKPDWPGERTSVHNRSTEGKRAVRHRRSDGSSAVRRTPRHRKVDKRPDLLSTYMNTPLVRVLEKHTALTSSNANSRTEDSPPGGKRD